MYHCKINPINLFANDSIVSKKFKRLRIRQKVKFDKLDKLKLQILHKVVVVREDYKSGNPG